MKLFIQISVFTVVAVTACTQLFLLFKYFQVRSTLNKMRETSSGDHHRFKNGSANSIRRNNHR